MGFPGAGVMAVEVAKSPVTTAFVSDSRKGSVL